MELGFFSERRGGRFCINSVTGPDEYSTVVDNNAYTNLMAKQNLEIAVRISEWLRAAGADVVTEEEGAQWRRAAELMYVPRHDELGIVLQDEHFLVVLATYLAGEHFSAEEKRRTFNYYDPLTTGDSTLSACVQSVIASEVGYADAALGYFMDASTVDLHDTHGNTADGIHVATCGGTWLALVAGFAGLRDSDGDVSFKPRLPESWDRLRFRIGVRGQLIEVDMTHDGTEYTLLDGCGLMIRHDDQERRLAPQALPRAA